jgi:hypothetical protein
MTKSDFTLGQAEIILNWMNITTIDFWQKKISITKPLVVFTRSQEEFLTKEPIAIYVLINAMKGLDLPELANEIGWPIHKMEKLLYQMDKINLIEIMPNNRFRVTSMGPFQWRENGPLENTYYSQFCQTIISKLVQDSTFVTSPRSKKTNHHFKPFEFYLSESTYREFGLEILNLIHHFQKRAIVESERLEGKQLIPVSGVFSAQIHDVWKEILIKPKKEATHYDR